MITRNVCRATFENNVRCKVSQPTHLTILRRRQNAASSNTPSEEDKGEGEKMDDGNWICCLECRLEDAFHMNKVTVKAMCGEPFCLWNLELDATGYNLDSKKNICPIQRSLERAKGKSDDYAGAFLATPQRTMDNISRKAYLLSLLWPHADSKQQRFGTYCWKACGNTELRSRPYTKCPV